MFNFMVVPTSNDIEYLIDQNIPYAILSAACWAAFGLLLSIF